MAMNVSRVVAVGILMCFVGSVLAQDTGQITCTGKVVDTQGRPVAGAKVKLERVKISEETLSYDLELAKELTTKEDGTFAFQMSTELEDLRAQSMIIAEKEGLAIGWANWRLRENSEVEIRLDQAKSLTGTVVDEAQRPVADAEVGIAIMLARTGGEERYLVGDMLGGLLTTRTDAEGRFSLDRIPGDATLELLVRKPGRATLSTFSQDRGGSLQFMAGQAGVKLVQPAEARIEGTVVERSAGRPVAGIKVMASPGQEQPNFGLRPVVSKEDGTFSIPALAPGTYRVQPVRQREGLAEWVAGPVEVVTESGQTRSGVKIELSKGGVLEVVVTETEGKKPVDRANVSVRQETGRTGFGGISDKDGIARIRLVPGQYQAMVYKEGYSRAARQDTVMIEEGKTTRVELQLAGQSKITGTVLDQQGRPVKGATLRICPMGGREVTSGEAGRFEIPFDPRSWGGSEVPTMILIGRHKASNLAAAQEITEDTRTVEVRLLPGLTFAGKVVDPNGKGIANARIDVSVRAGNWGSSIGTGPGLAQTDAQGAFEIVAIPADQRYGVNASADGYGTKDAEAVTDNAVNNRLDVGTLELPLANLSVSGVVVDANDKPVANARVSVYGDSQPYRTIQTDVNGRFTIKQICAGRIQISADTAGQGRLSGYVQAEGGATDVKVVVSDRSSGRPMPRPIPSLTGKSLPDLKTLGVSASDANDKALVVCFFDIEQRPSRRLLSELARKTDMLTAKGVSIVVIQISKVDLRQYEDWLKTNQITLPIHTVEGDFEAKKPTWGVKALPWLILTDKGHVVKAEGFAAGNLEKVLEQAGL